MDSSSKQSNFFGKVSPVSVNQLDKVNAFPNKSNDDDILTSGLSAEDQYYLNSLDDISECSDQEANDSDYQNPNWSPMIHSPRVTGKRVRKLRPPGAITLSLEDISYIRPSWGLSKGVRIIGHGKQSSKQSPKGREPSKSPMTKSKSKDKLTIDKVSLLNILTLTLLVLLVTLPPYYITKHRQFKRIRDHKMLVDVASRTINFFKPIDENFNQNYATPVMRLKFGLNIPRNLKPDECKCSFYESKDINVTSTNPSDSIYKTYQCVKCLDWASRANMRIFIDNSTYNNNNNNIINNEPSPNNNSTSQQVNRPLCYRIKWQNYNTQLNSLVDCFQLESLDTWIGLGDLQEPIWPLNRLEFDYSPLEANMSTEMKPSSLSLSNYNHNHKLHPSMRSQFGSYIRFSLMSSSRVSVGEVDTDFATSIRIKHDSSTGNKMICLMAHCTDKCTDTWNRADHIDRFRFRNNMLEYTVCSAANLEALMSRQFSTIPPLPAFASGHPQVGPKGSVANASRTASGKKLAQTIDIISANNHPNETEMMSMILPEVNINLIDKPVFTTSVEFMPILDGQTIRKMVDNIVKLDLKSGLILSIDGRWQTHSGSLKLNSALFPKAKLLLEILHNKGFRILFTVKPYIDNSIGSNFMNELLKNNRLYMTNLMIDGTRLTTNHRGFLYSFPKNTHNYRTATSTPELDSNMIVRRSSFLKHQVHEVSVRLNDSSSIAKYPLMFKCRESIEGHCALIDICQPANRNWLIQSIKRSEIIAFGADGIRLAGGHPNGFTWQDHYKQGLSELAKSLYYNEKVYTLPQMTGDFGYIELAPRPCTWDGLRSSLSSVINLGSMGFVIVHPGSVWGDSSWGNSSHSNSLGSMGSSKTQTRIQDTIYGNQGNTNEELMIRWLQLFVFMPVLQFNNLNPIDRYGLQEMLQSLVRIRKSHIAPELRRNLPHSPLMVQANKAMPSQWSGGQPRLPLIRAVFVSQEIRDLLVDDQFTIGNDLLVAPILSEGVRQRDIYLPSGFWRDELRQVSVRGGKWIRNYPVELNEVAWFTRDRRR